MSPLVKKHNVSVDRMEFIMKNTSKKSIISFLVAIIGVSMFCTTTAFGQSEEVKEKSKPEKRTKESVTKEDESLLSVFEPLAISASESTVKVQSGSTQIAVGTIVDTNGLILTKASEMRGELQCRLPNGDLVSASVFGIDTENDLALLKIEAEGLSVAPLKPVSIPTRGMWLVSPTDHDGSLTVGVVGVNERKIPPSRAFIGINMENQVDDGGVLIVSVEPGSPAQRSRLRPNDVIVKIDDLEIRNRIALVEAIGKYTPGMDISLTVKRADEDVVIRLTLADAQSTSRMNSRSRQQNNMGSRLSRRGKDFPRAFQHDMALDAKQCGGPVVDLDGQIVGINIARSGRVASLAIPVDVVVSVIERLKTGEFSPVKVYAERIEASKEELAEMESKLEASQSEFAESEKGYEDSAAKIEELERMASEIAERIKTVKKERVTLSRKKRVLKSKNSEVERAIRSLKRKLEAIKSGKKY